MPRTTILTAVLSAAITACKDDSAMTLQVDKLRARIDNLEKQATTDREAAAQLRTATMGTFKDVMSNIRYFGSFDDKGKVYARWWCEANGGCYRDQAQCDAGIQHEQIDLARRTKQPVGDLWTCNAQHVAYCSWLPRRATHPESNCFESLKNCTILAGDPTGCRGVE